MKQNKTDIRPYTKEFYRGNRLPFLAALVCTLLMSLVSLMVSWLLQQLLDLMGGYETGFTLEQLLLITLGMLGLLVLALFINYHSIPRFNTRGIRQYKAKIFQELTKKNICAFSAESASTYISALTNDIAAIEQGYLKNVFSLVESLLTFVGAMVLMLWYSPLLTLAAIGLTLLPLITSILTGNKMAQAEKAISRENETYTATLKDCLGGFSVIKSFQAEAQMLRLFQGDLQRLAEAQCRRQKMQILISALGSVAGVVAQLGVFLVGAYLALSGKGVTAGTTMVFVQLMNYVLSPIQTIPTCLAERKAAKALVQKAADLLGANVRENPDTDGAPLRDCICLRDLSFSYEPEKPVLKNINCTFSLGKKYAIVGASGSGKSAKCIHLQRHHKGQHHHVLLFPPGGGGQRHPAFRAFRPDGSQGRGLPLRRKRLQPLRRRKAANFHCPKPFEKVPGAAGGRGHRRPGRPDGLSDFQRHSGHGGADRHCHHPRPGGKAPAAL